MLNNIEELIKLYDDPPADGTRSMARDPMPTKPLHVSLNPYDTYA